MENYYFKHSTHFGDMFGIFEEFYRSNTMADVIIACDGKTIHAHRIVLSAGSEYFRRALVSIKHISQFPVLFINDIAYEDMESILEFIYRGQIVVTRDKVESLRQAAFKLRVKGFENFLRKPFLSNGMSNGINNQFKVSNGTMRNISMLNQEQNKRSMHTNEHVENKRPRMNQNSFDQNRSNGKEMLIFNRYSDEMKRMPNGHRENSLKKSFQSTPNGMQNKIHLEQLLKRAQESKPESPKFGLNEMKTAHPDSVSITPIRNENRSPNGDSQAIESCDENEDNHRNENTENGERIKVNGHHKPINGHNGNLANDECDSDDNEVNYTYEMDPNTLSWDTYNDENVPENHDESEGYDDEEDYFESVNRNQSMEMMMNQANLMKMNGQLSSQSGFFYCEHCPKYFFDEDHLQLHIKRSHGLNKLNQCNICGKTYAWKSGLYKHKRHVHGISGKTLGPMPVNDNVMEQTLPPSPVLALPPPMPMSLVTVKEEPQAITA